MNPRLVTQAPRVKMPKNLGIQKMPRRTTALMFVLLLGLSGIATLVPAQILPNPLVIASISFVDDQLPYVTNGPNELDAFRDRFDADLEVLVENQGQRTSLSYTLTVYRETLDGSTRELLNGERSELGSSTSGDPILAGNSFLHTFTWAADDEALGAWNLVVVLQESSPVEKYLMDVFVAEYKFALEANDESLQIAPDETKQIEVYLDNQGNADATITWDIIAGHARLTAWFDEATTVLPPGSHVKILNVHYPYVGVDDNVDDIQFSIRASNSINMWLTTLTGEIDIRNDEVPPPPGISLDGPAQDVYAAPGQSSTVQFTLTNTGTRPDTFTFGEPESPGGWDIGPPTIQGSEVQSLALAGGSSTIVEVIVRPLAGADRVTTLSLTATAASGIFDSGLATLKFSGPHPVVSHLQFVDSTIYRGEDALLTISYQNEGNAILDASTLTLRATYADGSIGSRSIQVQPVEAGRARTERFSVGLAQAEGPVTLEAHWRHSDDVESTVVNYGFVRLAELRLQAPVALPGFPGEVVRYHTPPHAFQITNEGNVAELVKLTVVGAEIVGAPQRIIDAGETLTVGLTQRIPSQIGSNDFYEVSLGAVLEFADDYAASASVKTPVRDSMTPEVEWVSLGTEMLEYTDAPAKVRATDDTFIHRVWLQVEPLEGGQGAEEAYLIPLHENGGDWLGLFDVGAAATLVVTPYAEDAYGNIGFGPSKTVVVSARGIEVPLPPLDVSVTVQNITLKGAELVIQTLEPVAVVTVNNKSTTHTILDGESTVPLQLGPGNHTVNVTVSRGSESVNKTANFSIESHEEKPGLLSRLIPSVAPGALLAALFVGVVVARIKRF